MSKPTIKNRTDEEITDSRLQFMDFAAECRKTNRLTNEMKFKLATDDVLFRAEYDYNPERRLCKKVAPEDELNNNGERYILLDPNLVNGKTSLDKAECYISDYTLVGTPTSGRSHHIDYSHKYSFRKLSTEELLNYFTEGSVKKPEKPKLGLLGWLRDVLSGLFPSLRSEEMKKYDRQVEAAQAKRYEIFEETTGCSVGIPFNRNLLDDAYARDYIAGKIQPAPVTEEVKQEPTPAPEKTQPTKPAPRYDEKVSSKNRMILKSAQAAISALSGKYTDDPLRLGADAVCDYLDRGGMDKEQGKELAQALAAGHESIRSGTPIPGELELSCAELLRKIGEQLGFDSSAERKTKVIESVIDENLLKKQTGGKKPTDSEEDPELEQGRFTLREDETFQPG